MVVFATWMDLVLPSSTVKLLVQIEISATVTGFGEMCAVSGTMLPLVSRPSIVNMLPTKLRPFGIWIALALVCTVSNRGALGPRVRARDQTRSVRSARGNASTGLRPIHSGIRESAMPLTVEINWPSGDSQTVELAPLSLPLAGGSILAPALTKRTRCRTSERGAVLQLKYAI